MANVDKLGRVIIPVSDQDAAIAFYTEKLGFTVLMDAPYGEGDRWVEVAPSGGGSGIALTTGMASSSPAGKPGSRSRPPMRAPRTTSWNHRESRSRSRWAATAPFRSSSCSRTRTATA